MKIFKLYKENRTDQEYELNEEQMIEEFEKWLPTRDPDWLFYYSQQCIRFFVCHGHGLNSVADSSEIRRIEETLVPVLDQYLEKEI